MYLYCIVCRGVKWYKTLWVLKAPICKGLIKPSPFQLTAKASSQCNRLLHFLQLSLLFCSKACKAGLQNSKQSSVVGSRMWRLLLQSILDVTKAWIMVTKSLSIDCNISCHNTHLLLSRSILSSNIRHKKKIKNKKLQNHFFTTKKMEIIC